MATGQYEDVCGWGGEGSERNKGGNSVMCIEGRPRSASLGAPLTPQRAVTRDLAADQRSVSRLLQVSGCVRFDHSDLYA